MEKLYLSARDIVNLMTKLDRVRAGEVSACTIIKNDTGHPVYPPSLRRIAVVAVEGEDRYMPGVSPRLQLSRASLTALLDQANDQVNSQACGAMQLPGLEIFAIPDSQYYVDRSEADAAPVGDLAAGFFWKRGKHT
ncbi:hypothetical protein EDC30_10799 [Paucimonas lemoignei]|uniref:Uncharacterized protein n=1 Tax=Paucimonas lemoignei TaxID=29443 RepID=A0A4R3HTB5_PAULE|nr:hypothetical protein [Paucimonas lemoignei]TCS36282.1 hypothetical protein EDC30_10799 [Paucimonas lemoignei]